MNVSICDIKLYILALPLWVCGLTMPEFVRYVNNATVCVSPDEFNIYTREAGAGGLSIAVEGPSKAEIDFQDKKDGSCQVSYRVSEPGLLIHTPFSTCNLCYLPLTHLHLCWH